MAPVASWAASGAAARGDVPSTAGASRKPARALSESGRRRLLFTVREKRDCALYEQVADQTEEHPDAYYGAENNRRGNR
jgi:hypothetical protein